MVKKKSASKTQITKPRKPAVKKSVVKAVKKTDSTTQDYAIFKNGGKQYQAITGKTLALEKITGEPGEKIVFNEVLLKKTGEKVEIGTPHVANATIKASIIKHDKSPKVIIFHFKRRKKSRVKKGHRQPLTIVRIEAI